MKIDISKPEVVESKSNEIERYKEIGSDTKQSLKEADDYWKSDFRNEDAIEVNSSYKDDDGKVYREGDSLLPNNEFTKNGYEYKTDEQGRTISAEGKLRMRDPSYSRSDTEKVTEIESQEYQDGDDKGHLIAFQFEGSNKLENLVPMDFKLNRGDYAKLENTLASAVKDGADVRVKVEPIYEGESTRPTAIKYAYSIDGDKDVVVFKNESEKSI